MALCEGQPRGRFDVFYRFKHGGYPCGLDSEFLMSGRVKAPEDVHSVQFSFGSPENTVVLETARELKEWLHNHRWVKIAYGFVILPDLGSIEEWLGEGHVSYRDRGSQLIGRIGYGGASITVYDARPLLQSFGLRRLEDCGRVVGFPKLAKPEWLGLRAWQNESEHEEFLKYAKADAIITSRIVAWLYERCGADPVLHASAGTLARDQFVLPKRLKRRKRRVVLSPLERAVKNACYAGRSEGFTVGFTPSVVYNDVKSLYPCSVVVSKALQIVDVVPCRFSELAISDDLNETRYGWVEGIFETDNDLWGLPLRGTNNFYATGVIQGFYHTFDLASAKARVVDVAHCYKPVFRCSEAHAKYADMLIRRIEGKMSKDENMLAKAVLNSLSGKLGQAHPIARTSNFFAYSTLLAHSHFVMSWLFDKCPSPILAMDTDSIFSQSDMSGKHFELTDGEYSIPIIMEVKGKGDLAFFRSKNYILKSKDGKFVFGRHGWVYWLEDYLKLFDGVNELWTRVDVKHTLLTKQKEAQALAKGRWKTKPVKLDLAKIKSLLTADIKRMRPTFDSYQLVLGRKHVGSRAWNYEYVMDMKDDNPLDFPNPIQAMMK